MKNVNWFRKRRGKLLASQVSALGKLLGRNVEILDVGGRKDYWLNIELENVTHISLLNYDAKEISDDESPQNGISFSNEIGDARSLSKYSDGSIDFIHSNSVIEHVGPWQDMASMASEMRRVGLSGWMQTPSWMFPLEPHFRAPFLHWFGQPLRRSMLSMSSYYRKLGVAERRYHIDRINLLTRCEVKALFPTAEIVTERVIFPKSYIAHWAPSKAQILCAQKGAD